jgi:hypothetical protein
MPMNKQQYMVLSAMSSQGVLHGICMPNVGAWMMLGEESLQREALVQCVAV